MKIVTLSRALKAAHLTFERSVYQIASDAREQLRPYFQKRGWKYTTWHGSWVITNRRGHRIEDDKLPACVRDVLWLQVGDARHLGSYIAEF